MILTPSILIQRAHSYAIGQTLCSYPNLSFAQIRDILSSDSDWTDYNDNCTEEEQMILPCEEYESCNGRELIQIMDDKCHSILHLFDEVLPS